MHPTSSSLRKTIGVLARASATGLISVALLAPAAAQFWPFGGFGGQRPPQRAPQQQQQQQYNPFGGFFGGQERRPQQQPQPKADY